MSSIAENPDSELSQPKTGWKLFCRLASGEITPGRAWRNPAYRRKFILRSLMKPFATAQLLNDLARQPQLPAMLNVQPGLPCRLHRPWLSVNCSQQQILDALNFHYQAMSEQLTPLALNGYLSRAGTLLATISGKDDRQFRIVLRAEPNLDKEGEATLSFVTEEDIVLAELTFTLCQLEGKRVMWIGGLQGAKANVSHQLIQDATKACHGLFPKRLLVEAAMSMGQSFSVERLQAVSNTTHIYRSIRYRKKKQGLLHADYDSFWQSLGAHPLASGDFQLPLVMPRKPMEEIASKKRAEYRRRYALLDSLQQQSVARCRP
ncbi:VirK/YbjX family protein [Klebsiella aerogenes]|nr:DUF535 domain-containing protein [Klebsiella aerogenes]EKW1130620.1 DUF535 domain-containing protein [Klebsiella aerogenes]